MLAFRNGKETCEVRHADSDILVYPIQLGTADGVLWPIALRASSPGTVSWPSVWHSNVCHDPCQTPVIQEIAINLGRISLKIKDNVSRHLSICLYSHYP